MRIGGRAAARGLLVLSLTACRDATPPADIAGATPMPAQAPYALWWAATEACSGLRGDLTAVRWAVGPDSTLLGPEGLAGHWEGATNRITLARAYVLDGSVVRHEMLHALLAIRSGETHPPAYFRGRCAGYVACPGPCATTPGTPPTPVGAGAPVLSLAALGLRPRLAVLPASFPADSNGGWLVVAVSVQNPEPYGVVAQLDPAGSLDAQSFGYQFGVSEDRTELDSAALAFGPGETRRFVFDVQTTGYRPGQYVVRGTFNTAPSDSAVVTIRP